MLCVSSAALFGLEAGLSVMSRPWVNFSPANSLAYKKGGGSFDRSHECDDHHRVGVCCSDCGSKDGGGGSKNG